jgi:hypothetical protein
LSAGALIVFLIVIFSGVWGLCIQQNIPRRMLEELPSETIVHVVDWPMKQYRVEAETLMAPYFAAAKAEPSESDVAGAQTKPKPTVRIQQLVKFYSDHIRSYLRDGGAKGLLGSAARSREFFADLRLQATPELETAVKRLEAICDTRRQMDHQAYLLRLLHYWLWVHTPFSFALLVLVAYHAVVALKLSW